MAETGHARNVERFAQMISFVQGYGVDYAPSNAAIAVAGLQAKLAAANAGIDGVTAALAPWRVLVNDRQNAFEGIRKLTTRVVNSFDASGAPKNAVEDAKLFKRKIDGARSDGDTIKIAMWLVNTPILSMGGRSPKNMTIDLLTKET